MNQTTLLNTLRKYLPADWVSFNPQHAPRTLQLQRTFPANGPKYGRPLWQWRSDTRKQAGELCRNLRANGVFAELYGVDVLLAWPVA
jgi:hypothetical protein